MSDCSDFRPKQGGTLGKEEGNEAARMGRADEAEDLDLFISHIERLKGVGEKRESEREKRLNPATSKEGG